MSSHQVVARQIHARIDESLSRRSKRSHRARLYSDQPRSSGKCVGGNPLKDEGKVVSGKQRIVADGPFAESKEAIAGYFYLTVADEKEAIEIAKQCPGLDYGSVVQGNACRREGVESCGELPSLCGIRQRPNRC